MSKVVMPLLSQDARGSFSGIQFSRGRYGNFGSRKSTSNRKQGDVATNHRARIKAAHTAWEALDPGLKACWETYAGPTQTGRNAFIGAALRNYLFQTAAPIESPLLGPGPTPITGLHWQAEWPVPRTPDLNWTPPSIVGGRVITYTHTPAGMATPHVRKFKYLNAVPDYFVFQECWPGYEVPWFAVRVIHWDHIRGVPIGEWAGAFDSHYDFWFGAEAP